MFQGEQETGETADPGATTDLPGTDTTGVVDGQGLISRFTDGDISPDDWGFLWTSIGWPMVKAIILLMVVFFIAGWARKIVGGAARKAKVEETLARFFGQLARWGVLLLGVLAVLQTFGVQTTSFAAVIAAAGFAVGMALSGTLGNFASGIMLLIFRPFKVGDVVSAGGVTGKVNTIDLFTTIFDTPDNRRLIVPNSAIWDGNIENVTFHDKRRVDVAVGTAYDADIDKTREVLMAAASAVQGRLSSDDPVVYLSELGGSSIDWSVRVWSSTADYWGIREQLTRDIKVALDGAGIGIPFPQMDVHMQRIDQPGAPA